MIDEQLFQEQCEQLKDRFRVDCTPDGKGTPIERWSAIFHDLTPEQVYTHLTRNTSGTKVQISLRDRPEQTHITLLHQRDFPKSATDLDNLIKFYILGTKTASLGNADLKSNMQGKNIAKPYMANTVSLLKNLGIEKLTVSSQSVGSYAWAKYGFIPASDGQCRAVQDSITGHIGQAAKTILYEDKWYPLLSQEQDEIKKFLHMDVADFYKNFHHLTELKRVIKPGDKGEPDITVGKALLMDSNWRGVLHLIDDDPGYERFKLYTGAKEREKQLAEAL